MRFLNGGLFQVKSFPPPTYTHLFFFFFFFFNHNLLQTPRFVFKMFARKSVIFISLACYPPGLNSSGGFWDSESICVRMYVYMYVCMYVCMYVYVCSSLVRFLLFGSPLKSFKSDYNQTWVKDAIGVP